MVELTAIEKINAALALARSRLNSHPDFGMYSSIVRQLESMEQALSGAEDESRMKDIILGVIAAKELADSDPEFAELLFAAGEIADKASRGLKI